MARIPITRLLPSLETFRSYKREWLGSDLVAGVSVAAVALPIGIAYAQLAGFPPVIGIYSCILPIVAYFFFGSSRQLVVNPDAAACAIVAATLTPLAVGSPDRYLELSIILTCFTGLLCIIGGLLGLGVIANFLSRPILTGYLNGIAISIIVGQLGTLLGYSVSSGGVFHTIYEVAAQIKQTHVSTLVVGLGLLIMLLLIKRLIPKLPAPFIAAVIGCLAVFAFNLASKGVAVVGHVPAGFPPPLIPRFSSSEFGPLLIGAAGISLVSFCSMMTTARGFAAKNGYNIDVNRDMVALGVSDLASALNRGFVVSGADSRTAVADSSGGKTQMASLFAALTMTLVLLFLTGPLAFLPRAALAAILISSAMGLFDVASMRDYYRISKPEFRQSMVAMVGVMTLGVLPGVLVAVALAIFKLLQQASHPRDELLGIVKTDIGDDFRSQADGGELIPEIIIYRFESSIVFFNADHFITRVRHVIDTSPTVPKCFLLDAEAIPFVDVSGAYTLRALRKELEERKIVFVVARLTNNFHSTLHRSGVIDEIGQHNVHHTIHHGVKRFRENGQ